LSPAETKGHRMDNTIDALFIVFGMYHQLKEAVLPVALDWHISMV